MCLCSQAFTIQYRRKIQLITKSVTENVCDDDLDGIKTVNLVQFIPQFTLDPTLHFTFHTTLADAQNNTNAIPASVNINTTNLLSVSKKWSLSGSRYN
jgi:hypothetical protein